MSSLEEFNETYQKFLETYGECSQLIAQGIELETTSESEVSDNNSNVITEIWLTR